MKHILWTLCCAFLAISVSAQSLVCQLGVGPASYSPYWNQAPTPYAVAELNTIANLLCISPCGRVDIVSNATAPNAVMMGIAPGHSMIAYNPAFMNQIFSAIGPEASFGIIAHEFGHHIDFNTTPQWMNTSWSRELKADAWAGCALAKRGFSPAQISLALQAIAAYPSPSHPAWNLRIPAVQQGFVACGGAVKALPWHR